MSKKGKNTGLELSVPGDRGVEVVDASGDGSKGKDLESGRDDAEKVSELMGEGPKASDLTVKTEAVKFVRALDKVGESAKLVLESHGPGVLEVFERVGEG